MDLPEFLQPSTDPDYVKVKICGITNSEDAWWAIENGADALGFIFYPFSKRLIDPSIAMSVISEIPESVTKIGVFVNLPAREICRIVDRTGIQIAQLHGHEPPDVINDINVPSIKAIRIKSEESLAEIEMYKPDAFLFDTYKEDAYGGTGETFNWDLLKKINVNVPVILSGGLEPGNIGDAIREVRPFAVDVASGVEAFPGKKSLQKIETFMSECRNAFK